MISHGSRRCYGCGHPGVRQVPIDGCLIWLCGDCPSPAEIRRRRDRIKRAWTEEEAAVRRFGCPSAQAMERLAWRPPVCSAIPGDTV